MLRYVEGSKAIEKANAIFGYNGWRCQTLHEEKEEVQRPDGSWSAGVIIRLRITTRCGGWQEDVGHGLAEKRQSKLEATGAAYKEAYTDATKRTLRRFGNALGLQLYFDRPVEIRQAAAAAKSAAAAGAPARRTLASQRTVPQPAHTRPAIPTRTPSMASKERNGTRPQAPPVAVGGQDMSRSHAPPQAPHAIAGEGPPSRTSAGDAKPHTPRNAPTPDTQQSVSRPREPPRPPLAVNTNHDTLRVTPTAGQDRNASRPHTSPAPDVKRSTSLPNTPHGALRASDRARDESHAHKHAAPEPVARTPAPTRPAPGPSAREEHVHGDVTPPAVDGARPQAPRHAAHWQRQVAKPCDHDVRASVSPVTPAPSAQDPPRPHARLPPPPPPPHVQLDRKRVAAQPDPRDAATKRPRPAPVAAPAHAPRPHDDARTRQSEVDELTALLVADLE